MKQETRYLRVTTYQILREICLELQLLGIDDLEKTDTECYERYIICNGIAKRALVRLNYIYCDVQWSHRINSRLIVYFNAIGFVNDMTTQLYYVDFNTV